MTHKMSIQKVYDKGSGKLNEDELLVKGNLFAVFDGVTSLVPFTNKEGKSGGRIGAEIVKQVFSENNQPLKDLASKANSQIKKTMEKEGINISQKEALWMVAAAVIKLTDGKLEFFQIGDCFILAILKNGSFKLLADVVDHDLETMILWRKLANRKEENIWDKLKLQIDKARREANITYGMLNGEEGVAKFFNFGEEKIGDIKSLILFTDGLLIPKEDHGAPENWKLFVEIYRKEGLSGLLNYVRSIETKDPNCWQHPRFKTHDDIAAIGIDF